jgi:dihydroorotate dehydrogenase electron transfer subunit
MTKMIKAQIKKIQLIKKQICKIDFESEDIASLALPGQFINIKCGEGIVPLLRRPISICDVDKKSNIVTVVFQIKANGTLILSEQKTGDYLDIIGPVGKGFDLSPTYKNIVVVGGGIGVFPLLYLLKESKANFKGGYLGFRNKEFVVLEDQFSQLVTDLGEGKKALKIFTDDGTYGEKGLVTDRLYEYIKLNKIDIVYACGPNMMLKGVADVASCANVKCQVSVEQRMGCGIGACLVCACKTKKNNTEDFEYKHVCKDGPVFWADKIIFD